MELADEKPIRAKKTKRTEEEAVTPQGKAAQLEAKAYKEAKKKAQVIEMWYELRNDKLVQCFKKISGSVRRIYVGNRANKKSGVDLKAFIDKIDKEGLLKRV